MYKSENRGLRFMRALVLIPAIVLAALAVNQPAIATTIGQAGSLLMLPTSVIEETIFGGIVNEIFSDCQLPESGELAVEQPSETVDCVAVGTTVEPQADPGAKDEVYNTVAQMPQFPGGEKALMKYVTDNIRYPADAMKAGDQGRVVVSFVVGADGRVRDASILSGCTTSLNAEALRVINSLPAFIPGKNINGESVAVYYNLPVNFKLKKNPNYPRRLENISANFGSSKYGKQFLLRSDGSITYYRFNKSEECVEQRSGRYKIMEYLVYNNIISYLEIRFNDGGSMSCRIGEGRDGYMYISDDIYLLKGKPLY